jgi:TPR repeat protein
MLMKLLISVNPMKKILFFVVFVLASTICIGQPVVDAAKSNFSKGLSAYEQHDYATAIAWIKKAAEQGNSEAQYQLGHLYRQGKGTTKNIEESFKWIKKSAEQGYIKAQYNLGLMYASGYGIAQNNQEAIKWYQKAAEQGNPEAQYFLGRMYYQGKGVTQNNQEAIKWYKVAAGNKGHGIGKQLAVAALQQLDKK